MYSSLRIKKFLPWTLFLILSISCAYLAYILFPIGFSLLHVDIRMNREQALKKARQIAQEFNWGPDQYHQAAFFGTDDDVKNFIELEAGGKDKLQEIIHEKKYELYQWIVRHYKEHSAHEVLLYFTPEGTPYGFKETYADNEPGAALDKAAAIEIAQETAQRHWNMNINDYKLVESSSGQKPGENQL